MNNTDINNPPEPQSDLTNAGPSVGESESETVMESGDKLRPSQKRGWDGAREDVSQTQKPPGMSLTFCNFPDPDVFSVSSNLCACAWKEKHLNGLNDAYKKYWNKLNDANRKVYQLQYFIVH
jgi:hypothetical protein